MKDRRLGRFKVSGLFLAGAENGEGANLFTGLIVLDAQRSWEQDFVTYVAWNAAFDPVERGQIIPEYEAWFDSTTSIPHWRRLDMNPLP